MSAFTELIGQELGPTDWLEVDQARIDEFARCTNDTHPRIKQKETRMRTASLKKRTPPPGKTAMRRASAPSDPSAVVNEFSDLVARASENTLVPNPLLTEKRQLTPSARKVDWRRRRSLGRS